MKSLRASTFDTRKKTIKSRYSLSKLDSSFNGKPTPLDFDSFIPWFCLELQVPKNVVVTRTNQAEYVRNDSKLSKLSSCSKSLKSRSRSTKIKLARSEIEERRISLIPKISFAATSVDITDAVPLTTCYDKRGRLVEIAIVGCPFPIPRKVIQAFNLCLPFHTGLFRLTIKKGGLCQALFHEISKLLPHSNITEICFDDSCVPNGDYSILLDQSSKIKYLSLKRCSISDEECKKIASKLDLKGPALKSLLVLDLTSNDITDEGAQALGGVLKNNRRLSHLNLSGNKISDGGASFIFRYLQEFPLTYDDVIEKRLRRMDYLRSRTITYEKCLEEVKSARNKNEVNNDINASNDQVTQTTNISQLRRRRQSKKSVVPSFIIKEITAEDEAEKKTKEILGEFKDVFEEQYIKRKGDLMYCIGNLTLTSLNLAYNNLSLLSVRKILSILKYQSEIKKFTSRTGLVRVVIDGNTIPIQCNELYEIDILLSRALWESEQSIDQFF